MMLFIICTLCVLYFVDVLSQDLVFSIDKYNEKYHTKYRDMTTGKVIVIYSKGQSGSTYIAEVISNLLKTDHHFLEEEILGMREDEVKEAFKDPIGKILKHLIALRSKTTGYIGYKHKVSLFWPSEMEVYKWWAGHKIPVIYSERNPLDLIIAQTKHSQNQLGYHCTTAACAENQKSVKVTINLDDLIERLQATDEYNTRVKYLLNAYKVKHMRITYEEMTFNDDQYRLNLAHAILKFIDPNNNYNATIDDFKSELMITNEYDHSKVIANFEQVKAKLLGTAYYLLLH